MTTPVAIFLFSDSDRVTRVLREVRRSRPRQVFLIADGPRADERDEARRCAETRDAAVGAVDWDCELYQDFSDTHLGSTLRAVSGLSALFEQTDAALILEDGCVPHRDFFRFCDTMLERYRDDERIMHVNGVAAGRAAPRFQASYSMTAFNEVGGWATWRRAWRHFDITAGLWPHFRATHRLQSLFPHHKQMREWFEDALERAFLHPYNPPRLTEWTPQWAFTCWSHHGLGLVPATSLVRTAPAADLDRAWFENSLLPSPLVHPPLVLKDVDADLRYLEEVLAPRLLGRPSPPSRQSPENPELVPHSRGTTRPGLAENPAAAS